MVKVRSRRKLGKRKVFKLKKVELELNTPKLSQGESRVEMGLRVVFRFGFLDRMTMTNVWRLYTAIVW